MISYRSCLSNQRKTAKYFTTETLRLFNPTLKRPPILSLLLLTSLPLLRTRRPPTSVATPDEPSVTVRHAASSPALTDHVEFLSTSDAPSQSQILI